MEVHQVIPALDVYDAVSNDTLEMKRLLQDMGHQSQIYSLYTSPLVAHEREALGKLKKAPRDAVIIYHYSISSEIPDILRKYDHDRILVYHNITPAHFFRRYDDTLYQLCKEGTEKLCSLKDDYKVAVGDSEYNRMELHEIGFKHTDVLPILLDLEKYRSYSKELYESLTRGSTTNILFVGRITPNKKQEDIIKAFYYYHRYINNDSRLYLIGKHQIPRYISELESLISGLGLGDSVKLVGSVNENDLAAYYRAADLFLCMSEHEGFCVPLLEAMSFNVPILAYRSTGVPYTLGGSGVLANTKDYVKIAEMMNLMIEDDRLRSVITKKQKERLCDFSRDKVVEKLRSVINQVKEV